MSAVPGVSAPARKKTPGPTPIAEADVSLWVRLLACHNLMLSEIRRCMDGEITLARFDLLANLEREDGQTLAALSRRMLVTAGNLTGLVDRAERDGVVVRRADPKDRRLSRVHLTRRGRALIAERIPVHTEHVRAALAGLDAPERRELRRLLGKLRDSLTQGAPARETAPDVRAKKQEET